MATNGNLKDKLAERAATPARANDPANTVYAYLKKMGPEIARALPKHMDPDRLARVALTTIRANPKLLQCNIQSLMGAVMQAAQLGLEPGLLGHCYIIPFGNEAQFMIGYRGMIDLARRSGNIESIQAHEVYENDYFKLKYGLEDTLEHIPWHLREDQKFDEPGAFRGCYMVAKFKDGGHQIHYMSKKEIDDHRKRSKTGNNGPWMTDYIEMAKKTVVRSAWKWLPISIEIMRQVESSDETVKKEINEDMTLVPDESDVIEVIPIKSEEAQEPEMEPEIRHNPDTSLSSDNLFSSKAQ
ncbi:MAG TPA: recombination protein RecT [Firmicutes bacterium]|nr:recombination protein RecT [Bacillota bacterium]